MHFFEQPCPAGWVYPCSLDDVTLCLARLPAEDIEGLWAVGLAPSTRKDCAVNARYFFGERPTIRLYSHPDALQFKLPPNTKQIDVNWGLCMELEYGMKVERQGSRFVCKWSAADLRLFILEHVLVHEVGHHVYHQRRRRQGVASFPSRVESEQFAEAYALRQRTQWNG